MATTDDNKAIVRAVLEEGWNNGNLSVVDQLHDPNYINHQYENTPNFAGLRGPDRVKQQITQLRNAIVGFQVTITDQVAEGDKVVTHWTASGIGRGQYLGLDRGGKQGQVHGITISRISNGKIVEESTHSDADRL